MAKKILTERDIVLAVRAGKNSLAVDKETILTPAAQDKARELKIIMTDVSGEKTVPPQPTVIRSESKADTIPSATVGGKLIAIGSDHGGYQTKEIIKKYLADLGYAVLDIGTNSEDACDYPDYAYAVSRIVAKGEAWRGIMIDATGVASAVVCNKIPGVRAAACYNEFVARSSREHNDANVLTLGARSLGIESMKAIVKVWLETWFGGGRHKKRIDKIEDIERRFSR